MEVFMLLPEGLKLGPASWGTGFSLRDFGFARSKKRTD